MILLASLAVGLVAYLAVGLLTGYLPRAGTRVQVPRRGRIERQTWLGNGPAGPGPGRSDAI